MEALPEQGGRMMMWWSGDGSWVHGWWWPGMVLMAVFMIGCLVMMARMMSHGVSGPRTGGSERHRGDAPERILANRLASGEIDLDEYGRLLGALQRTADWTRA
jgi:uncharacterized membrane protein